jgi:hypothetical protein
MNKAEAGSGTAATATKLSGVDEKKKTPGSIKGASA